MTKQIELARKLKALADRGVGGEKANAQELLDNLLKKHNLKIEDVESEKQERFFFTITDDVRKLWVQIVAVVNKELICYGPFEPKKIKEYKLPGNFCCECTASEYVEIEAMLGLYSKLYRAELDVFYTAFLTANDLLLTASEADIANISEEEREVYRRALALSSKIKSETYRKQLKNN